MNYEQNARPLVRNALTALRSLGVDIAWDSDSFHGARVRLLVEAKPITFDIEVKRAVSAPELGAVLSQLSHLRAPLLVTTHVPTHVARTLRSRGVCYIDTVGNAFLQGKGTFVLVEGQRPKTRAVTSPSRAFRPAGLRLIFALLSRVDLLNAPYRDMANAAPCALGGVSKVLDSLTEVGYLKELKGRRRLVNAQGLVNEWAQAYARNIWSRGVIARFTLPPMESVRNIDLPGDVVWGAESAAAIRTEFLNPEIQTVYAREIPGEFVARYRLRRDPEGRFEIRRRFWNFDHEFDTKGLVPPLLIYADLLAVGSGRTLEVARMIYEEIDRSLEQD